MKKVAFVLGLITCSSCVLLQSEIVENEKK